MSYISRQAAIDALEQSKDKTAKGEVGGFYNAIIQNNINRLIRLPSADVVEVVRKPIEGYEGYYEVDQFGRVYAVDRTVRVNDNGRVYDKSLVGKQLKQSMHTQGYKTVALTKDGKTKTHYVHRLVALAFIPNPDNLPMINHKDEDKTNNFVENLEWCTNEYNLKYGTASRRANAKKRGAPHSEEHKKKISDSMKRYFRERRTDETDYRKE